MEELKWPSPDLNPTELEEPKEKLANRWTCWSHWTHNQNDVSLHTVTKYFLGDADVNTVESLFHLLLFYRASCSVDALQLPSLFPVELHRCPRTYPLIWMSPRGLPSSWQAGEEVITRQKTSLIQHGASHNTGGQLSAPGTGSQWVHPSVSVGLQPSWACPQWRLHSSVPTVSITRTTLSSGCGQGWDPWLPVSGQQSSYLSCSSTNKLLCEFNILSCFNKSFLIYYTMGCALSLSLFVSLPNWNADWKPGLLI